MTDDFGRRFEAAIVAQIDKTDHYDSLLNNLLRIVRAANAQVSAPAKGEWTDGGKCYEESPSGAGVDLESAKEYLRSGFATIGGVYLAPKSAAALLSHIDALERDAERYRWLMDEGSGNSPLARANRIYAQWNGEDGAEGFSRVVDAARKEGK